MFLLPASWFVVLFFFLSISLGPQCAQISKHAGGIGLSIHNVRAANSYIRGTNGSSNGIVPMLRVFNNTARYVDQVCVYFVAFEGVGRFCHCRS